MRKAKTLLLCFVVVFAVAGCVTGTNREQNPLEKQGDLVASIADRTSDVSFHEIDRVMEDMGWKECSKVLGQFKFEDEHRQTVNNISVDKKAFKKDDYVYVVIALESLLIKEQDLICVSWDNHDVYAVERYHTGSFEVHSSNIGSEVFEVVSPLSRKRNWVALLFQVRRQVANAVIPMMTSVKSKDHNYQLRFIVHQ